MIPDSAPQWLKDAETENANVVIERGLVVWYDGDWHDGDWRGGIWHGGIWHGGSWHGGSWHGGDWHDGDWRGGIWHGGIWRGGTWHGGTWHGSEDRLLYMTAFLGIVFDTDGYATAYRSTKADGHGRFTPEWRQPEGEYYEQNLPPAGSGTCVRGIHVTSAVQAYIYFGVDPSAQLWRVRFRREDLLDCDGEKCRIRGGVFERISWPFLASKGGQP